MTMEDRINAQEKLNGIISEYEDTIQVLRTLIKNKLDELNSTSSARKRSILCTEIKMWQSSLNENREILNTLRNYCVPYKYKKETSKIKNSKKADESYSVSEIVKIYLERIGEVNEV